MTLAAPPAPGNSIHLVLGDSAAGCVRAAGASFSMPGAVFGFSGELAHGPLDAKALCSPWRALVARLDLEQADAVIVWSGGNVGDVIFVAMTLFRGQDDRFHFCHHLVVRYAGARVIQAGLQLGLEPRYVTVFLLLGFKLGHKGERTAFMSVLPLRPSRGKVYSGQAGRYLPAIDFCKIPSTVFRSSIGTCPGAELLAPTAKVSAEPKVQPNSRVNEP